MSYSLQIIFKNYYDESVPPDGSTINIYNDGVDQTNPDPAQLVDSGTVTGGSFTSSLAMPGSNYDVQITDPSNNVSWASFVPRYNDYEITVPYTFVTPVATFAETPVLYSYMEKTGVTATTWQHGTLATSLDGTSVPGSKNAGGGLGKTQYGSGFLTYDNLNWNFDCSTIINTLPAVQNILLTIKFQVEGVPFDGGAGTGVVTVDIHNPNDLLSATWGFPTVKRWVYGSPLPTDWTFDGEIELLVPRNLMTGNIIPFQVACDGMNSISTLYISATAKAITTK